MELQDAFGILRRRWWVIVVGFALGAALGLTLTATTEKTYSATSRLFVKPPASSTTDEALNGNRLTIQLLASYAATLKSQASTSLIKKSIESNLTAEDIKDKISAIPVPGTLLLDVRATDHDPRTAEVLANAGASALKAVISDIESTSTTSIRASVIDRAELPTKPTAPDAAHNLQIGMLAGFALGAALAVLLDILDRSIKNAGDAADAYGVPFVGSIPKQRRLASNPLASLNQGSPIGESYRVLRTAIRFRDVDDPLRTVLVTSSAAGDGKSTVAANLAIAMAQDGAKVILIDADLRRSRLGSLFKLAPGPGLTNVLLGKVKLRDTLVQHSRGLSILQVGSPGLNPSEALGSQAMATLLVQAKALADIVIIDAPPVLPVTDPAVLSALVDGTLVVCRWGRTSIHAAESTRQTLENVGANVIGVVLNAEGGGRSTNYYRHYSGRPAHRRGARARYGVDSPTLEPAVRTADRRDRSGGEVTASRARNIPNVGLLGLAIALTLAAGAGLSYFEHFSIARGWRARSFRRPGGVSLLIGVALAAILTGALSGNWFILLAAAVAPISGIDFVRRGGRLASFAVLFAGAVLVVLALDATIPAFGVRFGDVALTAFVLACFSTFVRESDSIGPDGWYAAMAAAAALTVMCGLLDRSDDASLALLITGALFGVVATTDFGSGMLGRTGSRFAGLVIGGMAVRAAVGSPHAVIGVVVASSIVIALWVISTGPGNRGRIGLAFAGIAFVMVALSIPALRAVKEVYKPMTRTVTASSSLLKPQPVERLRPTVEKLVPIEAAFQSYAKTLEARKVQLGRFVPFLGANLRAATASARGAANLSASAKTLLDQVNARALSPRTGIVPETELNRFEDGLRSVQFITAKAQKTLDAGGSPDLLVPQLRSGVGDLTSELNSIRRRVRVSLDATAAVRRTLGYDRPQRYFIAVQNTAESRATGGYVANYGIVTMQNGAVKTRLFRRTSEFDDPGSPPRVLHADADFMRRYSRFDVDRNWTNVNLSPDFPTTAAIMADQYQQFSKVRLDGVIAVDPIALAALMKLTGPVTVAGWPVPLTALNTAQVALHDEYVAFDGKPDERIDFLGRVATQVFDRLNGGGLSDLLVAGPIVHELTQSRRLQFWSPDAKVMRFFREVGADGRVPPAGHDEVLVTTQNAAGNKADYYLKRTMSYETTVKRDGDRLAVDSTLTIKLHNSAPATGQPKYIIGPHDAGQKAGQNRLFFTVYTPLAMTDPTIDGKALSLDRATELGRVAYSAFIDIPSGMTRTIQLHLSGKVLGKNTYVLDWVQQPTVKPDDFALTVHGAGPKGEFAYAGPLGRDVRIRLEIHRP